MKTCNMSFQHYLKQSFNHWVRLCAFLACWRKSPSASDSSGWALGHSCNQPSFGKKTTTRSPVEPETAPLVIEERLLQPQSAIRRMPVMITTPGCDRMSLHVVYDDTSDEADFRYQQKSNQFMLFSRKANSINP